MLAYKWCARRLPYEFEANAIVAASFRSGFTANVEGLP